VISASDLLAQTIEQYNPVKVVCLFSGGHDSFSATHFAMKRIPNAVVAHINTGIGIEKTRDFVREQCAANGWPLIEEHPPDLTYEQMVLKYGFPGPAAHRYAYSWLKERGLKNVIRRFRKPRSKDRVMLVTGIRSSESKRRMGNAKPVQVLPSQIWVSPIIDWDGRDINQYLERHCLPRNEVVDLLHMSGECLCGAFARPGELDEIKLWFPEVEQKIRNLEDQAREAGVWYKWGHEPEEKHDSRQGHLFNLPMCYGCLNDTSSQSEPNAFSHQAQ